MSDNSLVQVNLTEIFKTDDEIHTHLNESGILEQVYTKIATGVKMKELAKMLNLPLSTTEYILQCTRDGRAKLLEAKAFLIGNNSTEKLIDFSTASELTMEENNAAKHHRASFELAMKSQEDKTKGGDSSITVINNTIIAKPDDIPDEPEILKGII